MSTYSWVPFSEISETTELPETLSETWSISIEGAMGMGSGKFDLN